MHTARSDKMYFILTNKEYEARLALENLLDSEGMELAIDKDNFPITATISKKPDPQITVLDKEQEKPGYIKFIFYDEIQLKIDNFKISEDLLNKIKNRLKKWHYAHLELFFEKSKIGQEPR